MSFDTSQFLDAERRKEMIEKGKKDAMEDVMRLIRFGGGGAGYGRESGIKNDVFIYGRRALCVSLHNLRCGTAPHSSVDRVQNR